MKLATLTRLETTYAGTFGRLTCDGMVPLFTGELPWRDNAGGISCIPAGEYNVAWTYSPRFRRYMYLLLGTEPRLGIRIHPANWMGAADKGYRSQLNGCIALGRMMGWLSGQKAVLVSRPAVTQLEEHMDRKAFKLEIVDGWRS